MLYRAQRAADFDERIQDRPPVVRHCCLVRRHCRVTFTAQTTGAKSGASLPNSAESSNVEEPERCSDALACESYAGAQAIITAKNFICARTVPRILGNGRRGFKTFLLSITASCCLCRRQGGPTIFASGTRLKIDRVGITSIGRLSLRGNRTALQINKAEPVNILTALAENESVVKNGNDPERKAIALAWLFHLVGDIHQPLHTAQLFTTDYPKGDRGGNEICVRVKEAEQPMDLHRFWDGVITSSSNLTRLRNEATALLSR